MVVRPPHFWWWGFPPFFFQAVLLWLGLHFRSCLVWRCFLFLGGGASLRSFWVVFLSLPPLFGCCLFCHSFFVGGWCFFPLFLFGGVASLHFFEAVLPFSVVPVGIEFEQCLSAIKFEFLGGGAARCIRSARVCLHAHSAD